MSTLPKKPPTKKKDLDLVCFCGLCQGKCSFKDRKTLAKHYKTFGEWEKYALAQEHKYQAEQDNKGLTQFAGSKS
jgi:hypothetical protein